MQWLAEICVKRPVFASVLILILCVVGLAGYAKLGVDRFPKVDFPTITITTRLDGAAPTEVETEITDKVEEAVNTISGIDELRSQSNEGVSQVFVTFVLEKNPDVAAQEVRDRINSIIPQLPEGIDQPTVEKLDPDASPILYLALRTDKPIRDATEVADKQVRRALENVSGVGQVLLLGGRKRQINVWLDPVRLQAAGLTPIDVQRALMAQNTQIPGGSIKTGPRDLTLRVLGRAESPEAIGRIVVRQRGQNPIRVSDVANVDDGAEEAASKARIDDTEAVVLAIRKQSGENTVAVVHEVRERVAELQKQLPAGYRLEITRDNSTVIENAIDAVKEHLAVGAVFAAIVVLIFLGSVRSTFIAAIAIPTSIIATFGIMWMQHFTLNVITLLALALAVGIVIDDAIVVLENIVRFVDEKGMDPYRASVEATKEIGLAVLATTFSLFAVFVPVAFMSGIVGRFLNSFGLTMSFAIGVSLLVSFTLTPMLAARMLKARKLDASGHHQKPVLERIVDSFYGPIERVYVAILEWVMRHRWVVLLASLGALWAVGPLFKKVPKNFLPADDESQIQMSIRAPEGTSIEATELTALRIARAVRQVPGVKFTLTTIGDDNARTPNLANIYVRLVEVDQRNTSQADLIVKIRDQVVAKQDKNLRISVGLVPAFSGGGNQNVDVAYIITGPDLEALTRFSERGLDELKKLPGVVDADTSLIVGKPEVQISIDREKAADLGVQVADIGNALRLFVGGDKSGNYEERGEQYDVRIRAADEFRADPKSLALMSVPSSKLGTVRVLDVVKVGDGTGPAQINRYNRRRQVTLSSNLKPGSNESGTITALDQKVKALGLPPGFTAGPTGRSRELARTGQNFILAFGMTFIFMYLVLAAQFESWLHPVTILLSLPLTLPFALISLLMFGQALNIFSALGLLVLFGVVKKNAILQIDHTNHLRAQGMSRHDAIIAANRDRLRPILMTTLAFVAGMIPLIMSTGAGSGTNRATAGVVVGGQTLSLLLTLLATPVAYSYFDDLSAFFSRLFGGGPKPEAPTPVSGDHA
jgi:HAE1 family hydrophobic/amphiphilic exporter-1